MSADYGESSADRRIISWAGDHEASYALGQLANRIILGKEQNSPARLQQIRNDNHSVWKTRRCDRIARLQDIFRGVTGIMRFPVNLDDLLHQIHNPNFDNFRASVSLEFFLSIIGQ